MSHLALVAALALPSVVHADGGPNSVRAPAVSRTRRAAGHLAGSVAALGRADRQGVVARAVRRTAMGRHWTARAAAARYRALHPGAIGAERNFLPGYLFENWARNAATPEEREIALRGLAGATVLSGTAGARRGVRKASRRGVAGKFEYWQAIHDARNTDAMPGERVRDHDQPPTDDPRVNEAFEHVRHAADTFEQVFGFPMIVLGRTMGRLTTTVHFNYHPGSEGWNNAGWTGNQIVAGDGDGKKFRPLTEDEDVLFHEVTHGVWAYRRGLPPFFQTGALNESIGDYFAYVIRQYKAGMTVDQDDYLLGKRVFMPGVHARALRAGLQPGTAYDDPVFGKDPQPDHMDRYVETDEDSGGVHINASIPTLAGLRFSLAMGGHIWDRSAQVWWKGMADIDGDSTFQQAAHKTYRAAAALYPDDPTVRAHVADAWASVGLPVSTATRASVATELAARRAGRAVAQRVRGQ